MIDIASESLIDIGSESSLFLGSNDTDPRRGSISEPVTVQERSALRASRLGTGRRIRRIRLGIDRDLRAGSARRCVQVPGPRRPHGRRALRAGPWPAVTVGHSRARWRARCWFRSPGIVGCACVHERRVLCAGARAHSCRPGGLGHRDAGQHCRNSLKCTDGCGGMVYPTLPLNPWAPRCCGVLPPFPNFPSAATPCIGK
jgi:hypothetical protein